MHRSTALRSTGSRALQRAALLFAAAALLATTLFAAPGMAEWSGVVASIDDTGLTLAGSSEKFSISGSVTELLTGRALAASDVKVGASVTLRVGPRATDGRLPASETVVQTAAPLALTGTLEAVASDGSAIRVQGIVIGIDARTAFGGSARTRSIADLSVGRLVRVTLTPTSTGPRAAEVLDEGQPEVERNEAKGVVTGLDAGSITLADGSVFQIVAATRFVGSPAIGDTVEIQFHVETGGAKIADRIEKEDAGQDEVELRGTVEQIMPTSWTVSGQVLQIVATTVISGSPTVGDTVEVHGHHSGSDVVADRIEKVNAPDPGEDVEFEGTVEMMSAASWTISGRTVTIAPTTVIEGSPAVGDRVDVHAVRTGTSLVASRIRKEDANPPNEGDQVEFRGTVQSKGSTWTISGRTVAVDASTEIEGSPAVGDTVDVEAVRRSDGTLLARKIQKEEADDDGGGSRRR